MGRPRTINDDEIIRTLARRGPLSAGSVAEALGIHRNAARCHLTELIDAGRVTALDANGERSHTLYSLANSGPSVEYAAEGSSGLWSDRPAVSSVFVEQLLDIADAAWHYDNMDIDQADHMFDTITDWMRRTLVGYRPRSILPGFVQQRRDAA